MQDTDEALLIVKNYIKSVKSSMPAGKYTSLENRVILRNLKDPNLPKDERIVYYNILANNFLSKGFEKKYIQRALIYFLKGSDLDDGNAQFSIGCILRDYPHCLADEHLKLSPIEFFEKSHKNGNMEANVVLAKLYLTGSHGYARDEKRALELYTQAANNNNHNAMLNLAICHLQGQGTAVNVKKAFDMLQKVFINFKDESVYLMLGACYEKGIDGKPDYGNAARCFKKSIEKTNDSRAKFKLGDYYIRGLGVDKDPKKGFAMIKEAAEAGCHEAQIELASLMVKKDYCPENLPAKLENQDFEDIETGFWDLIRASAANNNPMALYTMGRKLCETKDSEHDKKLGFHYLYAAANRNLPEAQYEVGVAYFNGMGVKQNYLKAMEWFLKAESNNFVTAKYYLALIHLYGDGALKDYKKAREYAETLTNTGDLHAKNLLAKIYYEGLGVKVDLEMYFKLMSDIVQEDKDGLCVEAQFNYGRSLLEGTGVQKNEKRGFEILFEIEKTKKMPGVYEKLQQCYQNGLGTEVDSKKAFDCLYALNGAKASADTHLKLADLYFKGQGTPVLLEKAFIHYRCAAERGSLSGMNSLAFCHLQGIGTKKDASAAFKIWSEAASSKEKILEKFKNKDCVPEILSNLGWCYLNGLGVEEDKAKAFEYFNKAYDKGSRLGGLHLALCLIYGWGVASNRQSGIELLNIVNKLGMESSEHPMVGISSGMDYHLIFNDVQVNDVQESQTAQNKYEDNVIFRGIAEYYIKGLARTLEKNALDKLYNAKVDSLHNTKFTVLNTQKTKDLIENLKFSPIFEDSQNIDLCDAFNYIKKFALMGFKPAFNALAAFIEKNADAKSLCYSFMLYQQAADKGDPKGMFNLARCYEVGVGTKKDIKASMEAYVTAKKLGFTDNEHGAGDTSTENNVCDQAIARVAKAAKRMMELETLEQRLLNIKTRL